MAYIEKEVVKEIRQELRKELPDYKVSVRCRDYCCVDVRLVSGKNDLGMEYEQLNHYYPENYENEHVRGFMEKAMEVITSKADFHNRNAGDPTADYCDMTFYIHLSIGAWDKPYKQVA